MQCFPIQFSATNCDVKSGSVVSLVLLNNIRVIARKRMNIDTFRILITLGSLCYEIFFSWQYNDYTLIDWYEDNSEFIVPRDTNYFPMRSQGQLLMSREQQTCYYANIQSISVLLYRTA